MLAIPELGLGSGPNDADLNEPGGSDAQGLGEQQRHPIAVARDSANISLRITSVWLLCVWLGKVDPVFSRLPG